MLETPVIIGIAVAAALVVLVAAGAAISIHVQRKKNQRYLTGLSQDLAAYQRTRLSAYDNNYAHERIDRQESPAQLPDDSPMPPKARRKRSLRDSLYGHSGITVPKTRRQKKIAKAIALKDMSRSPLSAITELTDSTEPPNAVELPAERTPKVSHDLVSPVQPTVTWSLRNTALSPVEIDTPVSLQEEPNISPIQEMPHSESKRSDLSEAPDGPLPELPVFDKHSHVAQNRRHSQVSTDTVGSSVLGAAMSSPAEGQGPFKVNSGLQDFDFGFSNRSTPRIGPSPGRTTGWHSGGPGVASVTPSFDFQGRKWSTLSINQPSTIREVPKEGSEGFVPDAEFFFGTPRQVSERHSMLDYSLSTRSQQAGERDREMVASASPTNLPPRPASVASSNPYKLDHKPSFGSSRLSTGSTGSGRRTPGHRRQNCIRISIPMPVKQRRPSPFSDILEDSDDDIEVSPNKVQIVGITKVSPADRKRTSYRRSVPVVDENGSPTISPMSNRPVLSPSKPKRTTSYASRISPVSRPESDVFFSAVDLNNMDSKPKTPDPFANPDRWALAPTPPSAATLKPPPALGKDSPTLPSPLAPLKITSNTASALTALPLVEPSPTRPSRLMGPRSPPSVMSTNVHLQTAHTVARAASPPKATAYSSPVTTPVEQPVQATAEARPDNDLRQSVSLLRSMDTVGRHLNDKSRLYPQTTSFMSSTSSRNNHDDWKELNAIWEVSRSNSIDSVSTRAITRDNSVVHGQHYAGRGHRYSLSQGNPVTSYTGSTGANVGISRNNSISAMGQSSGYGMRQGSVSAGGGYLPQESNGFSFAHSRQPSMFGSSKRKMSMASSHSPKPSQTSMSRDWNMATKQDNYEHISGNNVRSSGNLYQSSNWGHTGNMSRAGSPGRMSMASLGGMSIWEDESIRAESPEPLSRQHSVQTRLNRSASNGPGPALPAPDPPQRVNPTPQQQANQGLGITTSAPNSKPKPIVFDDTYSQAHLVSPLNDSDMENLTPTAHTFGNSRYVFNFPAVPTTKRVPSRGNAGPPAAQQGSVTSPAAKGSVSTGTAFSASTATTPSSSILASPSLQPQPLRSHIVTAVPDQQQQRSPQQATPRNQPQGLGLRVGDKLLGTPGSLRSLYDGDGFLKESPLRAKVHQGVVRDGSAFEREWEGADAQRRGDRLGEAERFRESFGMKLQSGDGMMAIGTTAPTRINV
ncbi:uncharacterized protein AB675_10031 [Cyphellophora attinorum]|uniref:Uncharacterized protein n=1 Tax=Cyphellophora attinorum TaxID=1664694 RepID=A0A0N0NJ96_9EURO|nr:uncharacterized protein AB675_10031 [Phialophora attinorum]KPI36658.1 hypothetical protein AB675_10031 [Phialophora attinorum]